MTWTLLQDLLVIIGLGVLTLGWVGCWRFPDLPMRLHATAKIGSLGLASILLAVACSGEAALAARALLIALFLVLTAPIATYAVANAHERRMEGEPGDVEEAQR